MRQRPVNPARPAPHKNSIKILFYSHFLGVVFPPRCAGCRAWNEAIFCDACDIELQKVVAPLCACCGTPFDPAARVLPDSLCADCRDNRYHRAPKLDKRRAPFRYSGPIREAIHDFKYRGKTALAAPLADLLTAYSNNPAHGLPLGEIELIVPVPLHAVRAWRRGYNQSALLAEELGKVSGIPFAELLQRTRHTIPQVELEAGERAQNVQGAFAINPRQWPRYSKVESILLIDDVSTTGSTLEECARILKNQGVKTVSALTLAR